MPSRRASRCRTALAGALALASVASALVAQEPPRRTVVTAAPPELVIQSGLKGAVTSLAVSPDGSRAVTAEFRSGRLLFWDLHTGLQVRSVRWSPDIAALAFLPDGRRLVAATALSTTDLIDAVAARRIMPLRAGLFTSAFDTEDGPRPLNEQSAVAVGATGLIAAPDVVDSRPVVHLWSAEMRWRRTLPVAIDDEGGLSTNVTALAFSPGDSLLAIGQADGVVQLWRTSDHRRLWTQNWSGDSTAGAECDTWSQRCGARGFAFSADGTRLVAATRARAVVLHTANGTPDRRLPIDSVRSVTHVPAFDAVAVGAAAGAVVVRLDGSVIATVAGLSPVDNIAPVGGSPLLAVASGTRFRIIDAHTGETVRSFDTTAVSIPEPALIGADPLLLIGIDSVTSRWGLDATQTPRSTRRSPNVLQLQPSRDGSRVLLLSRGAADRRQSLRLEDAESGAERWTIPVDAVQRVGFSPDDSLIVCLVNRERVVVLDAANGAATDTIVVASRFGADESLPGIAYAAEFIRGGQEWILATLGTAPGNVARLDLWRAGSTVPQTVARTQERGPSVMLAISRDGRYAAWSYPEGFVVRTFDLATGRPGSTVNTNGRSLQFGPSGALLAIGGSDGRLTLWDAAVGREVAAFAAHDDILDRLSFSARGDWLLSGARDGSIRLWRPATSRPVARMFFGGEGRLVVTEAGHYAGDRRIMSGLAFRVGDRAVPFDQFDLEYNRPDEVLRALGGDAALIAAYADAYRRRLRRLDRDSAGTVAGELPVLRVQRTRVPLATSDTSVWLPIELDGAERLHIVVNGVPIHGSVGLRLDDPSVRADSGGGHRVPVRLLPGLNRIQLSAADSSGLESLTETVDVTSRAALRRPDLHVITIGVSKYADSRFDLGYAAKDARDVAALLARDAARYGSVFIDTLLDARVTRDRILDLQQRLARTRPEDVVIVFLSGHGLLDDHLRYHFATSDTDFGDPAARGLPFDLLEGLLDGIPARRKLLFLDTCHAGEVDAPRSPERASDAGVFLRARPIPGARGPSPVRGVDASSRLVDELFYDLRRASGTTVIAASAGAEYALESAQWRNGAFTFALREALESRAADRNGDRGVTVSELRVYLERRVPELTGGRQQPVARREHPAADFLVIGR